MVTRVKCGSLWKQKWQAAEVRQGTSWVFLNHKSLGTIRVFQLLLHYLDKSQYQPWPKSGWDMHSPLGLGCVNQPQAPRPPSMTWQMATPTSQHFRRLPPDRTRMMLAPKVLDIKSSGV